jgi:group I intron endonuclease
MKISGIYKIESKIKSERIYIGSSCNIKRRWENHKYDLSRNKHGSNKLQNHYNKYGKDDLVFSIIEECENDYLIIREQFYIDSLSPFFNNRKIANSQLGIKRSEETKRKLSERMKGLYAKENNPNYGRHQTEEAKQKMRDAHIGRVHHKHTEEWKKKAKERMLGDKNPSYGRKTWQSGRRMSEETKLKLSLSKKGKPSKTKGVKKPPASDELKLKRSINQLGKNNSFYEKHHTNEAKEKIKGSWIIRKLRKSA